MNLGEQKHQEHNPIKKTRTEKLYQKQNKDTDQQTQKENLLIIIDQELTQSQVIYRRLCTDHNGTDSMQK